MSYKLKTTLPANKVIRLKYLRANQAWVWLFGTNMLRVDGRIFFDTKDVANQAMDAMMGSV